MKIIEARKRALSSGAGEYILADLELSGAYSGHLEEGKAFHVAGDTAVFLENRGLSEAVYVIAGGHSGGGHHH
jgi:hypothetical protein